nr:hypothetical protein KitaXyl93_20510 [Kitasatospora sp. Xyl93]
MNQPQPAPPDRLIIEVCRDGWTKKLQINIAKVDKNGCGHGYRLAGPKFNGSSTGLLKTELDERDASEIRSYLDAVFPQASTPPPSAEDVPTLVARVRELEAENERLRDVLKRTQTLAKMDPPTCAGCGHLESAHDPANERECIASAAQIWDCSCNLYVPCHPEPTT